MKPKTKKKEKGT